MGSEVKNPLRAQSKYGLMGSSTKTGKFFIGGVTGALFWVKNTYTSNLVYMCAKEFRGHKSSNRIISIHSKVIVNLLIWVSSALGGGGADGWRVSRVNNYNLCEFRSVQR